MKKKEKQCTVCPFWSPVEKTCKMQAIGIFIPLDDHIEIYCKRPEHILCQQYRLGQTANQETGDAEGKTRAGNRRQFPRVMTHHPLTLVRLSDSGQVVCHRPSRASTIDISSGGMRLTTRELLMHDSIIQFHFKGSLPSPLKSGLAKVKWCEPSGNDLEYHAGLAFQNDEIIQAMDSYLGSRA
jgi:hypothetical protein